MHRKGTKMSKQFREIRDRLGLSIQEMASRAGVSVSFLYSFEAGESGTLQSRTRRALGLAYGVDPVTGEAVQAQAQEPAPASSATS
jgi:transcriptional regulator with XRE-family HTH domain